MTIRAEEAAAQLDALIEQINRDQEAVAVTSTQGTAYLVPAGEYESLRETVYLLRSPRNASRLRASVAEARSRAGSAAERPVYSPPPLTRTVQQIEEGLPRQGC